MKLKLIVLPLAFLSFGIFKHADVIAFYILNATILFIVSGCYVLDQSDKTDSN